MLVFLFSWIIIKVLRQTQIKISALNIYCKDCHTTLSVPSLFGHSALYSFFLVLRKLSLVSYCVVVWVLFGVFLCFCITPFGDFTCPQHQDTAHYKVWNLPLKRPPKMQFRGCLREITHGNHTTTGLFQEKSRHIFFLEENLLHLISKLWYEWFQFVNESSLYTFSSVVYSMNKEQVRGQTIRQVVNYKKLKTMKRVVFYERFNFITELWLRKFWCFESNKGWSQGCSTVLLNRGFLFFHVKIQLQQSLSLKAVQTINTKNVN